MTINLKSDGYLQVKLEADILKMSEQDVAFVLEVRQMLQEYLKEKQKAADLAQPRQLLEQTND